ncbi:serine hydrolase [Flagellimonas meridianipacifica]|uniref:CubicO group peptidase (Beta-lactamase class C family) n=1 Tax=Flagellimonas meridianipacifica TaxID=1080225 RepID=A0A2T0MBT1_9FLAO|nr:serine hydrolase [Allomuricauda pacifica]PRX54892.1 CubicO group peptidase (beta-lactamase class C family) [Allomuricauda pacifica]
MRTTRLVVLIMIFAHTTFAQKQEIKAKTHNREWPSLEAKHFKVIPIKDSELRRDYELYVKLPESYSKNPDKLYPVLYFTDAIWHLEILSASTEYMLEDIILVGISWQKNSSQDLKEEVGEHVSRFRDYSMQESKKPEIQNKYQLGQANKHLDFIRNNVIKYIEGNYRADSRSRTYFGYSLGGEFGSYVLLSKPDTFDNYIIGSPSIKNEVPYLAELNTKLDSISSDEDNSLHANVFLSYGTQESEMVEPIQGLVGVLKGRRDRGLSLQKEVIEGNHQTAFPMTAVRSVAWLTTIMSHVSNHSDELPFFDTPQINKAFLNATPEDKNDGIEVGEVGIDGGDKKMIQEVAEEISDKKHGFFDSFLIYQKDKLIFESYYSRGRINQPHPQASATKAYTSLALGRAIQMGFLTMADLEKPLVSFLKELDSSRFVKGTELITLEKALTMSTGISIPDEQWEAFKKDPSQIQGQQLVQTILEHSAPITPDTQKFVYGTGPDLIMQVIEAVVPGSAEDFIKTELLDKLGITNYKWQTAPSGLPEAGWRTSMTSRNMVKWGMLTMNRGKWEGEQLVSKEFIDKALSRILLTGDDDVYGGGKDVSKQGYGFYWWSADLKVGDKTYFCRSAQGGGGQYIILIDELDLLVVVTAHDNENKTLQLMAERIIPAFL